MHLIIAFDTEDFATPQAWDAQKFWADELTARRIRGSFQCVGQLIRTLQARRPDVLHALARHEIGYHTDRHSLAPTHPQGVAGLPLDQAINWVLQTEARGLQTLRDAFGRDPISFAQPGRAWTAAGLLAMASVGIKVWTNPSFKITPGRPTWYCGLLAVGYDLAFEDFFSTDDADLDLFKSRVNDLALAAGRDGTVCLYSHPTRLVTTQFWDRPCFGATPLTFDQIPPAPLREPAHIQQLHDRVRRMLDWLAARTDVHWTDYASTYTRHAHPRHDLPALLRESNLQPDQVGRLPQRILPDQPLSPDNLWQNKKPYRWGPLPDDLDRDALIHQARALAWTARLAEPSPTPA
ncbi:MAG: hypothetical protein IT441_05170 [Phycisphaeraceae bacterium]|nr:hypothetical protein [Phycisphaeraceae bacterium]